MRRSAIERVVSVAVLLQITACLMPVPPVDDAAWPGPANRYSWDGSWCPEPEELPPEGLFDDVYYDGHVVGNQVSPMLPPGTWDWVDPENGAVTPLASWNRFRDLIGDFLLLTDDTDGAYGWRLIPVSEGTQMLNYDAGPFLGSSGPDITDLWPDGGINYTGELGFGDGPDMVRYRQCWAADWRTGSSATGHARDNDLVIAGSDEGLPAGQYDVRTSTVHTGPGRDLVFVNNIERAAVDLGNGSNGRTDSLDPYDGDDTAVIGGNAYDFRVYGGAGDDTFFWLVDETHQSTPWIGCSFFGGGGWNPACWDAGTDRLVLVIPTDTEVVAGSPQPGQVMVTIAGEYPEDPVADAPTEGDVYARYYGTAGTGPGARKTVTMSYVSESESVRTGYCGLTSIEELQIGVGNGAVVYRIDDVAGTTAPASDLEPIAAVPSRNASHDVFEAFGWRR